MVRIDCNDRRDGDVGFTKIATPHYGPGRDQFVPQPSSRSTSRFPIEQTIAVYQKLAPKIKEMKALGMSYRDIAASLGIDKKTVGKALSHSAKSSFLRQN